MTTPRRRLEEIRRRTVALGLCLRVTSGSGGELWSFFDADSRLAADWRPDTGSLSVTGTGLVRKAGTAEAALEMIAEHLKGGG